MQFRRIFATFGKLSSCELTLAPGLNIIEAPNESGKSTLASFLRVMLYGLSTRERGAAADKNRFAPWHGGAMEGRLDLTYRGADITLTRDTARANSPMGRFRAVYTGTDEPYPDLDGTNCGEKLLGVPREVYERSAFIRQSGIAVEQDAELERRIAALITTGEESSSYTEVMGALKKQLNARKHNKTGAIPKLELELQDERRTLEQLRALTAQKTDAEAQLDGLSSQIAALREELSLHERADRQEEALALREAKRELEKTETEAAVFARLLQSDATPTRETLLDARSQLRALDELRENRAEAERALKEAERAPIEEVKAPIIIYVLAAVYLITVLPLLLPYGSPDLKIASAVVCAAATGALVFLIRKLKRQRLAANAAHETKVQEAKAAVSVLSAAYESAAQKLCALLSIADAARAKSAIDSALSRHDTLSVLEKKAQEARLRCELLSQRADTSDEVDAAPVERPARSRAALSSALETAEAEKRGTQSRIDHLAGTLRSFGELSELEASIEEKSRKLTELQLEYDALALAMDTLERANGELQSRFSPELGRRAAEYFAALTNGKYDSVLLDRSFGASAAEVGSPIARESASLSQGAADQLYFAVRLAICELLLGEESVPLVLDDALTNFDDARCAAALELLLEKSKTQQILLFTCQSREAAHLGGREGVSVQTLTAAPSCN